MNNVAVVENQQFNLIDSIDINNVSVVMQKIQSFQKVVQSALKKGHDFGEVPGTSKPTLLKPGAEKICMMMGLAPEYEFLSKTEDYHNEFFAYNFRCRLVKNGNVVCEGVGSCNSKEKKYKYTWVQESDIPFGIDKESLKSKENYGKTQYRVETPDIATIANTILKMGKKRALVDAVLQVASLSEIFTQDVEDMKDFLKNEQVENMTVEDASVIKLSFGKHKGTTLGDIYRNDKGYFSWLTDNAKDLVIKKACKIIAKGVAEHKAKKKVQQINEEIANTDEIADVPVTDNSDDVMEEPSPTEYIEDDDLPFK